MVVSGCVFGFFLRDKINEHHKSSTPKQVQAFFQGPVLGLTVIANDNVSEVVTRDSSL